MSEKVESLRNIALVAHSGAGKTSLAEAMLYDSGILKRACCCRWMAASMTGWKAGDLG